MGLVYVIVRTFPFWAVPLALSLVAAAIRNSRRHGRGRKTLLLVLQAVALLALSAVYLLNSGHERAVPWFYEIFASKEAPMRGLAGETGLR